ncbi:MAG TPA: energy transducer TonB, partial [Salinivirga sp.]|uniref:energy transducer TonB n=1 Tax=Salinivirga sp. TaxID=1970192 RepID=UPI002B461928
NKRIRGKVLVQFVITDKGKVSDVEVIKSAHPLLDEEARRVVSSMPNWKPAKFMGEHVNVMYQVPINFKLTAFW